MRPNSLVGRASRNIVSEFKNIGIYPFNRNIFTEEDFTSANVYDQPILAEAMNLPNTLKENADEKVVNLSEQAENQSDDGSSQKDSNLSIQSGLPIQGQANASLMIPLVDLQPCSSSMFPQTPISEILRLPKAPPRKYTSIKQ